MLRLGIERARAVGARRGAVVGVADLVVIARAEEQFEGVVSRFPTGNKSPDALLKAGLSAQQLGKTEIAKSWFSKLQREYPQSEAARKVPRTPDVTEKRGEGQ